jgi:hypothetical protein
VGGGCPLTADERGERRIFKGKPQVTQKIEEIIVLYGLSCMSRNCGIRKMRYYSKRKREK